MFREKKYIILVHDKWLIITIVLLFFILFFSLYPLNSPSNFSANDKLHHLLAYSLLSFPVSIKKPRFYIPICIFFIIFGGFIELVQPYFNRYLEFYDFLTNTVGIIIGMIFGFIVRKYYL
tara:strand:+ start:1346 stop:1705 length:360 start_codon:yes stop_codon:yes gene_type:complete